MNSENQSLLESENIAPLRMQLAAQVNLNFPDFEKHYEIMPKPRPKAYTFEVFDCRDWYRELVIRVTGAIEKREFLPLYRMGHGEYAAALGGIYTDWMPIWKLPPRQIAKRLLKTVTGTRGTLKTGSVEYGWEEYTAEEMNKIRSRYAGTISKIANQGVLALGLHNTPSYEAYIPEILDWFDQNHISLNHSNYHHVYSVYAMMHGKDREKIYKGRNVLVLTGLTSEKRNGIQTGLLREGVASVQFIPISPNKAMFEIIDLTTIKMPVDLVLIGAGIGSVNILCQLEPLQTACLDVGFVLSTLVDPTLRWNRPFCVPDSEFDLTKVRWLATEYLKSLPST